MLLEQFNNLVGNSNISIVRIGRKNLFPWVIWADINNDFCQNNLPEWDQASHELPTSMHENAIENSQVNVVSDMINNL